MSWTENMLDHVVRLLRVLFTLLEVLLIGRNRREIHQIHCDVLALWSFARDAFAQHRFRPTLRFVVVVAAVGHFGESSHGADAILRPGIAGITQQGVGLLELSARVLGIA